MINISVLFNQLIMLFLIICTGYLAYKLQYFDELTNKKLNKLVVNITLPMTTIDSVLSMTQRPKGSTVLFVFIASIVLYAILPIISYIIIKLIRMPFNTQGAYIFMLTFSNVGFMGFPVIQAAFGFEQGTTAVFYAAILNIIFTCCTFTYGVVVIGYGTAKKMAFTLKNILSPGIICSLLSIVIYALDVNFPVPVTNAISILGGLTSPLAMMLIGSTLASMKIREIFKDKRVYLFTFVKLIIMPLICYPLFQLFIKAALIRNVFFIESLMPAANTALIFATEFDLDSKLVSRTIFLTTLLSLFTIPLFLYLFAV